MSVEAMKQALNALNTTNTHPISSHEQYDKEMWAMEALGDAIADTEEVTVDWEAVAADQALTIAMLRQRDYLMDQQRAQVEAIKKRSFSDDVGRLLSTGKGFYDDGTPIDHKEVQVKIEGVGEDVFECKEVRIPRPPQRTWVGLTEEEIDEMLDATIGFDSCFGPETAFARAIEAKLRERNT